VKVIRSANHYVLQLGKQEKQLLFELLKLYPRIPAGHQSLSKSGGLPEAEANQGMLEEALAEQRAANQKEVQRFVSDPRRCEETEAGVRLRLSPADFEWLLQILNDIRVGSWILLGSPDPDLEEAQLDKSTAPHFWVMRLAGDFQARLLYPFEKPRK
jgi:hypothetical protein